MGKILLKIDKILEQQDRTIYWLGQQTGMSHNNLSKLVKNETNSIRFDKLVDIMEALDIYDISDVLEYTSDIEL